jgi:hypothetical protein
MKKLHRKTNRIFVGKYFESCKLENGIGEMYIQERDTINRISEAPFHSKRKFL